MNRISGVNMDEESAAGVSYVKRSGGGYDIDTDAVMQQIAAYVNEAEKYSVAGLCIALGITRETLDLWRAGYVCANDTMDKQTAANASLAECIAKGELYIHRYWEESDKSTTLHTKFLENAGVIGDSRPAGYMLPFSLGKLKKYCR
ncbi:MAG: hypothetical protein ACOX8Q_06275 [Christensenellales bacterium]|jgi:hypothetical protein